MNDVGQCWRGPWELGVHVVGAIEPAQRAEVDDHLAACRQCRAELAGLAGLPALLRKVPADEVLQLSPDTARPAGPTLSALLGQVARVRRRWRLATAAAAITASAATASGLLAVHAGRPSAIRRSGRESPRRQSTRRRGPGLRSATPPSRGAQNWKYESPA